MKPISRFPQPASQAGFTVIELMIAVLLSSVLLVLALPSFRETAVRNNVSTLNNELIHSMNIARSEAVRRGIPVTISSSGNSASWSGGWVVKAGTTTLSTQSAVPTGGYTICGKSSGGGTDGTITFTSIGALGGATNFDINVNRPDGNKVLSRHLIIGGSGQVQTMPNTTGSPALSSC